MEAVASADAISTRPVGEAGGDASDRVAIIGSRGLAGASTFGGGSWAIFTTAGAATKGGGADGAARKFRPI